MSFSRLLSLYILKYGSFILSVVHYIVVLDFYNTQSSYKFAPDLYSNIASFRSDKNCCFHGNQCKKYGYCTVMRMAADALATVASFFHLCRNCLLCLAK